MTLLKWVGGKTWLLDEIENRMPHDYRDYYEPFAGGAALFFREAAKIQALEQLASSPSSKVRRVGECRAFFVSDENRALIDTYVAVRSRPSKVISHLFRFAKRHKTGAQRTYTAIRRAWNADEGDLYERAAMFIYLNRTGFNGLYRVNQTDAFNVPMGRYKDPQICDGERVVRCAHLLKLASLSRTDFSTCRAGARDFVYFDPPYDETFNAYGSDRFSRFRQEQLARTARALRDRGAFVMLSNSNTPWVRSTYKSAGFKLHRVKRPGTMSSKATKRGRVVELLITSY